MNAARGSSNCESREISKQQTVAFFCCSGDFWGVDLKAILDIINVARRICYTRESEASLKLSAGGNDMSTAKLIAGILELDCAASALKETE